MPQRIPHHTQVVLGSQLQHFFRIPAEGPVCGLVWRGPAVVCILARAGCQVCIGVAPAQQPSCFCGSEGLDVSLGLFPLVETGVLMVCFLCVLPLGGGQVCIGVALAQHVSLYFWTLGTALGP